MIRQEKDFSSLPLSEWEKGMAKHLLTLACETDRFELRDERKIRLAEKLADCRLLVRDGDHWTMGSDEQRLRQTALSLPAYGIDHDETVRFAKWLASKGRDRLYILCLPSKFSEHLDCCDAERFADGVERLVTKASQDQPTESVFWGLKPMRSDFKRGSPNAKSIDKVKLFIIDADHPDHGKMPATLEGKRCARDVYDTAASFLCGQQGWPRPALIDSGNGPQAYWAIDLPADKTSTKLIGECQKALKQLAGDAIDAGNNDLTQNGRLPGTWNARHAETLDRPHRLCRFLDEGDAEVVEAKALQEVIAYANKLRAEMPPRTGNIPPGFNANDHGESESPMHWCNRNMKWEEILVGWHRMGSQQDGSVWWLRPGKNIESNNSPSATTGVAKDRHGNDALYVFSTNASPLESGYSYDKYGAYTLLHHNGDFKASARAILELMGKEKAETKGDQPGVSANTAQAASPQPKPKRFNPLHSREFFERDYTPQCLIEDVLVAGQPAVVSGGSKSMKTSILIEAALSLGCGVPFFDKWRVSQKQRVAVFSGESGDFTIQETALRIAKAKGVAPLDSDVYWDFTLPRFTHPDDIAEIAQFVREHGIKVVMIDPLYLALTAEAKERVNTGDVYGMGPLILGFCRAMLAAGATPIIVHHFKKGHGVAQNEDDTPELEEMAMAGIQEAARQWWLFKRRRKYEEGTGHHELWYAFGGSLGHGGKVGIDIDEGVINKDFGGRHWEATVRTVKECREESQSDSGERDYEKRDRRKDATNKRNSIKLMMAFNYFIENKKKDDVLPAGIACWSACRNRAGLSGDMAKRAYSALEDEGVLEVFDYTYNVPHPRNGKKSRSVTIQALRHRQSAFGLVLLPLTAEPASLATRPVRIEAGLVRLPVGSIHPRWTPGRLLRLPSGPRADC